MNFKRARIIACEARPNYILWVRFDDGVEGEVNLSDLVGQGVFKAWESNEFWESVKVDPESETVCWGEDIDLDPYVLKQEILDSQKHSTPSLMEKERIPMTLGMIRINHPKLLDHFEALAKPYCTRLFDLGEEHKGIAEFIASGTFVRIGNRPGVLTNHHVSMIFDLRKQNWIYVPGYKSEKIHGIRIKSIISLPHYPEELGIRGVDISFIELESETDVLDLGYQIWDLDKSAANHFSQKLSLKNEPRPEGRGMIWEGFRTPPKFGSE